jgi:hypothetical protein
MSMTGGLFSTGEILETDCASVSIDLSFTVEISGTDSVSITGGLSFTEGISETDSLSMTGGLSFTCEISETGLEKLERTNGYSESEEFDRTAKITSSGAFYASVDYSGTELGHWSSNLTETRNLSMTHELTISGQGTGSMDFGDSFMNAKQRMALSDKFNESDGLSLSENWLGSDGSISNTEIGLPTGQFLASEHFDSSMSRRHYGSISAWLDGTMENETLTEMSGNLGSPENARQVISKKQDDVILYIVAILLAMAFDLALFARLLYVENHVISRDSGAKDIASDFAE